MDDKSKQAQANLEQMQQINQAGVKIQEDLSRQAPISAAETQQLLQSDQQLNNLAQASGSNLSQNSQGMMNFGQQNPQNMQNFQSPQSTMGQGQNPQGKKSKAWLIGIMVVVILGIIGGVVALIAINGSQEEQKPSAPEIDTPIVDDENSNAPKDDNANETTEADVQEIVNAMQVSLEGYFNKDEKTLEFSTDNSVAPFYQSDNMKAGARLDRSIGFVADLPTSSDGQLNTSDNLANLFNNDELVNLVNKTFEEHGFVRYGEDLIPSGEYINNDKGIVCTGIDGGIPIYFGCGSVNWISTEKIDLVNALTDAYHRAHPNYNPTYTNINVSDIKDSEVKPYQNLQVQILGGYELFYRTSPEAEWQYFAGGQAPLECSDYNTDDLRKAFAGRVCYNGNDESKVQP